MDPDPFQQKIADYVSRIVIVDHVGDNSKHGFLAEREWACIIEFPSQKSNRALHVIGALEAQLSAIAARTPDLCFDTHFAIHNYPRDARQREDQGAFDGESVIVKLYKNDGLVPKPTIAFSGTRTG